MTKREKEKKPQMEAQEEAKKVSKTAASKEAVATPVISTPSDLAEPLITENSEKVLQNRYLKKDKVTGEVVEVPKDMFWRVAASVAAPEYKTDKATGDHWAHRFYDMMATGVFMPNSPTLMNAGREMGMLSACFVLPVEDSIDSIFQTLRHVAMIQKSGGGTGFSFSRLRPDGDIVASSGGQTSGPMSFIDAYSAGTDAIQQGAFRRGANMGVLRCDHPDVVEFMTAKDDLSRWTNYNVSVAVTNEWMQQVVDKPEEPMVVHNPRNGQKAWLRKTEGRRSSMADYEAYAAGEPNAEANYWTYGEVMDRAIRFAWKNGEPGLLFIDRANEDNMLPNLGELESTNPCGEQWLLPYSSCNLGSINLGRFYRKEGSESANWEDKFDWPAFDQVVHDSVRFLDDVVTINKFPIDEIRDRAEQERRIGLGVMGFADILYSMGVRYGSEKSFEIGRKISARMFDQSVLASENLVTEDKRAPYLAWEGSKPQIEGKLLRRNSHLTTVAPTGTISIIAGCSGGIEPLFSLAFQRQVMKDADGKPVVMKEVNPEFRNAMEAANYSADQIDAVIDIALAEGSIAHAGLNEDLTNTYVTAHDVVPAEHIQMQGAWQSSIDNAVSKTINLPNECSEEDVRTAYLLAWREGCKGVTVYRDGCREMQPMALKEKAKAEVADANPVTELKPQRLPEIMPCVRIRQMTPFGNMHVKISVDPVSDREMEVFAQLGKGGDVANSDLEAICRMLSLFLRCNGRMDLAISQLEGIGSSLTVPSKDGRIMSLADGLAKAIRKFLHAKATHGMRAILLGEVDPANLELQNSSTAPNPTGGKRMGTGTGGAFKVKCPSCEGTLAFEEGCCKCYSCGYSQC